MAMATAVCTGSFLAPIVTALEAQQPTRNGQLLYKYRLVLPSGSPWVAQLLAEFHYTPFGGHSVFLRTYKRIASNLLCRNEGEYNEVCG